MTEQTSARFGEPTPLPMDAFHTINAATLRHAPTTNDDLLKLVAFQPSWETLAPSSVTPHLLRRILSDDTAIHTLIQERDDDTRAVARLLDQIDAVWDDNADRTDGLIAAESLRERFAGRIAELE